VSLDRTALAQAIAARGPLVRVLILFAAGSVPREAGTPLLVWAAAAEGTVGGGALENEAVAEARRLLAEGGGPLRRTVPLGPALGQCCGGSVTLVWERLEAAPALARALGPVRGEPPALVPGAAPAFRDGWLAESEPAEPRPLWVWGAGHVGRAIVAVMAPLPDRAITWVDLAPGLFPAAVPAGVTVVPAAAPAALVPFAAPDADHLVLTRSHALDLALCDALLRHRFASLGLIGSQTKLARFRGRLRDLGHSAEQIGRIACPIGDPGLGKHPQAIAVGVAAALIREAGASGTGLQGDASGCPTG
jgi:xanthine dehydrogenase accessory factor